MEDNRFLSLIFLRYNGRMSEKTENLVLEHLRAIRTDVGDLKTSVRAIRDEIIGLRNQFHIMQGDALRQEQNIATMNVDLERIKSRLNLTDA